MDLDRIQEAIKLGELKIRGSKQAQHVVIFWGYTGTGKSTTIILLNGQKVYSYIENGVAVINNMKDPIDIQKRKQKEKDGQVVIFIEQNIQSGTVLPSFLPMKNTGYQDRVILWDSPGFGDNKGITQILINTYYIHRLFAIQNQVKLVFTMNFNDIKLDQKGEKFGRVIQTLVNALRKFKDYQKSMAILVTKCTIYVKQDDIYDLLVKNCSVIDKDKKNPQIQRFVKIIEQKNISILMIRQPNPGFCKKSSPKEVTKDYAEFRDQFYKVIKKLTPAKVPRLEAPGMTPKDVELCLQFANNNKNSFNQQLENMSSLLQGCFHKFFHKKTKNIDELLISMTNIRILYNQMIVTVNNTIETMEQYQKISLFFSNKSKLSILVQFKYEEVIKSFQRQKNLIIIANFISSLQIPQDKNSCRLGEILSIFSNRLEKVLSSIEIEKEAYETNIKLEYEKYIITQIAENLRRWENEKCYQQWKQMNAAVPYFYLQLVRLDQSKNLLCYLQTLEKVEIDGDMQLAKQIKDLIKFHQDHQGSLKCDEKKIVKNVRKLIHDQYSKMKSRENHDTWRIQDLRKAFDCFKNRDKQTGQNKRLLVQKQKQIETKSSQIERLTKQIRLVENKNQDELTKKIFEYEKEREKLNSSINRYLQEKKTAESQLKEIRRQIKEQAQKNSQLKIQNCELKQKEKYNQNLIKDLKKELEDHKKCCKLI